MSEPTKATPPVRHDGWTIERQRAFIERLAECGSVTAAAESVGISKVTAYRHRRGRDGAAFRRAWDMALSAATRRLVDVAMERAIDGVDVPIVAKGQIIGYRTVYNDRLLMFMLRQRAPHTYSPLAYHPGIEIRIDEGQCDKEYAAMDALGGEKPPHA